MAVNDPAPSVLLLHPPSGDPLVVRPSRVEALGPADGAGDAVDAIEMTLVLDGPSFARVEAEGLFGLATADRGFTLDALDDDRDVVVEVTLASELIDDALAVPLADAPDDHPLLATESWTLRHASQLRDDGLQTGFSTGAGGRMSQALLQFLVQDDWPFERGPAGAGAVYRTSFRGECGEWACEGHPLDETEQLVFLSIHPELVPAASIAAMAECCARINMTLVVGSFDLDVVDGTVRFRTSIDVEGSEVPTPLVRQLVHANVLTMDRFFEALRTVAAGGDPAAAVEAVIGD